MNRIIKILMFTLVLCAINGSCWEIFCNILGIPMIFNILICGITGGIIGWNSKKMYESIFERK